MSDVRVRFEPEGVVVTVPRGSTLLAAAGAAGVAVDAPCGGVGSCGACRVLVSGGVSEPGPTERGSLGAAVRGGTRLACLALAEGPGEVVVQRIARGDVRAELGSTGAPLVPPEVEPPASRGIPAGRGRAIGAAVDLGTTTIAARLHALDDGSVIAEAGGPNPQACFGADVLSRVSRALEGDADDLRSAAALGIGTIVAGLLADAGGDQDHLAEMALVGNPAMVGLLLDQDLEALATASAGGAGGPIVTSTRAAGITGLPDVPLYVPPSASSFVGADCLAGVLATSLTTRGATSLLIDLGTNGEVALAAGGRLLAASAAAGPAFEGAGLSSGMGAEPGAIESVWIERDELRHATVGGAPARGICGSGLVDLLAVLLDAETLDSSGRLHHTGPLASRVRDDPEGRLFMVDGEVALTQMDVRAAQLAKAAVQTAVQVLLLESGTAPEGVGDVLVAGGFGSRLRPSALAAIGVIPQTWVGRVTFVGNSALDGASRVLLSSAARREVEEIARATRVVPLATRADFQERFLGALAFEAPLDI